MLLPPPRKHAWIDIQPSKQPAAASLAFTVTPSLSLTDIEEEVVLLGAALQAHHPRRQPRVGVEVVRTPGPNVRVPVWRRVAAALVWPAVLWSLALLLLLAGWAVWQGLALAF